MIDLAHEGSGRGVARIGSQPIALAAGALVVMLAAIAAIGFWRAYAGASPERDRAALDRQLQARQVEARQLDARLLQARATLASEQLVEKTKGLEVTQQESIDQLQMMQDQLQQMRKQLAAQQADTKHLTDQMSTLSEAVESLRQSFASAQNSEPTNSEPSHHHRALRARVHAVRASHHAAQSGD